MPLFRPDVERMAGYVPGEQPRAGEWVKLNTNENPYPPSPAVVEAIRSAATSRLNVYPAPLATPFREAAGEVLGVDADWILPANGSDENLTILLRTFVDPGEQVAYPYPSYVLYETLAELQGARHERIILNDDWSFDWPRTEPIVQASKLVFVPNPNSPSGNRWSDDDLRRLRPTQGLLVVDEAYGDFAEQPGSIDWLRNDESCDVVITRTLSKSYSLAGLRFGFAIARPDLIAGMRKVKDSYNCDAISIAAATAAIRDQPWMRDNRAKIIATRQRLAARLAQQGFDVTPSEANFVWCSHPSSDQRGIYERLKQRQILVRYMTFPGCVTASDETYEEVTRDGLRITVGTDEQVDRFLDGLKQVL